MGSLGLSFCLKFLLAPMTINPLTYGGSYPLFVGVRSSHQNHVEGSTIEKLDWWRTINWGESFSRSSGMFSMFEGGPHGKF